MPGPEGRDRGTGSPASRARASRRRLCRWVPRVSDGGKRTRTRKRTRRRISSRWGASRRGPRGPHRPRPRERGGHRERTPPAESSDPRIHLLLFFWDRGPVTRSSWTIDLWSWCGERKRNGPQPPRRSTSRHSLREDPASSSMRPSPYRRALSLPARRRHPLPPPGLGLRSRTLGLGAIFPVPTSPQVFSRLCMTALDDRSAAMSPALYVVSPPT